VARRASNDPGDVGEGGRREGTRHIVGTIALALLVVGGLSWGLVGLVHLEFGAAVFGGQGAALARVVYVLVGISAIISLTLKLATVKPVPKLRPRGRRRPSDPAT
jgi:uncharacterized membrane protein YuzA (DUF378 family)